MKKFVLSLALAAAVAGGCDGDDEGKDGNGGSVSAPAPDRVIPGSFVNDRDEAGFKEKLPETSSVMQSTTSNLSLRGGSGKMPTKKANLTRGMVLALADEIGIPVGAKQELSKIQGISYFGDDMSDDWSKDDVDQGKAMYEDVGELEVGQDCTMLLNQLSGQYDTALSSYTQAVQRIASTDFSTQEGFTKDAVDSTKEAFAYKVYLDTAEDGGKANVSGRFAGGANDTAVAFTLNGVLAFETDQGSGNVGLDLNNYADIPGKALSFGVGVGLDVAGKDDSGKDVRGQGAITVKTTLTGGSTPGQTLTVKGEFSDGTDTASGELNVALQRQSTDTMTLDVDAKNSNGDSVTRSVTMTITKSMGYETCAVAAVAD